MRFNERTLGGALIVMGLLGLCLPLFWPQEAATGQELDELYAPARELLHQPPERTACRVLTVYDGDTVGCDLNRNGRIDRPTEQVRFLGIDTPEMHYSRKNATHASTTETDEPYAAEASAYIVEHAQDETLYLEFDEQREDPYGRTLAYAYLNPFGGTSLGEQLLARGFATVLTFEPNTRHAQHYTRIEAAARHKKRGLWGR